MESRDIPTEARPNHGWSRYALPSASDLLFVLALGAMTVGSLAARLLGDAGIGWHIRNGELILKTHAITRNDPFSVTMGGQSWYAWEWLYDTVIAAIHHRAALNGVVLFTALIIAATFALTMRLCLRRGADLLSAAVMLALALGASTIHLLARPHVLSWLFTVIWFQVLDSAHDGTSRSDRRLWRLPALMLVWVNLHGGFIVGFALLGIYLLSDAVQYFRSDREEMQRRNTGGLRRLGAVTGAVVLASFVNPYGPKLHLHVFHYLSNRWLMNHIDEFLSPNFHGVAQQCFVGLLLIAIVTLAMLREKPRLCHGLVLLFAAYTGLYASRGLPVSSLLLVLIVAPWVTQMLREAHEGGRLPPRLREGLAHWQNFAARMGRTEASLRGHIWPLAAVAAAIAICINQGRISSYQAMNAHFDASKFPVEAATFIADAGLRDPVLSLDSWGGYLIYRLYPQIKVFVDDRHDLYGDEFLRDYLKAVRLTPGWDKFLVEKHVNWVLVPAQSPLGNMLAETRQWDVVHRDQTAALLARKERRE